MKINELLSEIQLTTQGRYLLQSDGSEPNVIESSGMTAKVIQLKRVANHNRYREANWKTIIMIESSDLVNISQATSFAASIKEKLTDPQTSDIYLFIIHEIKDFSLESALKIEASELICRKYVLRPQETSSAFLKRTFLSDLSSIANSVTISDPISVALAKTKISHNSLSDSEINKWRELLFSDSVGRDLAAQISALEDGGDDVP